MSAAGVWQLEPEVCILCTGSWAGREGPEHTQRPILQEILTDHWKSTNSTAQPGQHQKDIDDIPPHHHTTHYLHLHTINNLSHTDSLSSSQTVPAIPPTSLTDWTGLEGLCEANGGGWQMVKGHTERGRAHPNKSTGNAQLQKSRPNLRHQS